MLPVIDLEASSLNPNSYPIEVGIFVPTIDGDIEKSWLIKPIKDWLNNREWNDKSAKIHNISQNELIQSGVSGYDVCKELNSLLSGTTIYSDAPDFDEWWLEVLFNEWNISMEFDIGYILCPDNKNYRKKCQKLGVHEFRDLKEKYIKKNKITSHRALDDAKMMGLIMRKFLKK